LKTLDRRTRVKDVQEYQV